MSSYRSYMHIEKIGTAEVEGILNGTCYLFYKIDGTNSCIWLKNDGTIGFGSRRRELSDDSDNADFKKLLSQDEESMNQLKEYFKEYPDRIIYGEWLVPHTIKRYSQDAWKKLYVFDIWSTKENKYINYDFWADELKEKCPSINIIPCLAKLNNPTLEDITSLLDKTGDYLITSGVGEGIVIKNYDFVNRYGRTTFAKILTEDFRNDKHKTRSNNKMEKEEFAIEHSIIQMLTVEHIQKEYYKLIENKGGEWSSKYIFELLNRTWDAFIADNFEIILKKFKLPTINFRVLRQMSDTKIKETLGL